MRIVKRQALAYFFVITMCALCGYRGSAQVGIDPLREWPRRGCPPRCPNNASQDLNISVVPAQLGEESGGDRLAALVVVSGAQHPGAIGLTIETSAHQEPAPELVVTISPSEVKIPDNSKKGTRLAKIEVRRSNGDPFTGQVRLTHNSGGICQLPSTELELGRDMTKADAYRTFVCTVTAFK